MSATTPLTRPLQDAITWTKTWQNNHKNLAKAFLIPVDDMIACFNEMGVKFKTDSNGKLQVDSDGHEPYVRSYVGTDGNREEHLLIVGTTTKDGIQYDDIVETPTGESLVYDFTKPCPSDCDPKSKLNHKVTIAFSK
ncbi:hypothetical protein [Psychroserpens sp. SPM9]|uniref:hypothetical protein n=1 Tax=Psychroserpens sp. SPM9 TaxID=2975598 RepID=UPI0021A61DBD|nr:hypothetical protein [Psychroserpens sp. SPM9]MDG5490388.1 hypothetical protein [Psychroserpens sp. SPM9]